jgi:hypothetical protein
MSVCAPFRTERLQDHPQIIDLRRCEGSEFGNARWLKLAIHNFGLRERAVGLGLPKILLNYTSFTPSARRQGLQTKISISHSRALPPHQSPASFSRIFFAKSAIPRQHAYPKQSDRQDILEEQPKQAINLSGPRSQGLCTGKFPSFASITCG